MARITRVASARASKRQYVEAVLEQARELVDGLEA